MKISITHPHAKSVLDSEQQPVYLQEISGIDSSTCVSINLADCMDYVPLKERGEVLNTAIDKLRRGGEITISGADLIAVSSLICNGQTSVEQANASLYGGRLSVDTIFNVVRYLESIGMEIVNAKLDNLYYAITARRKDAE